jgi:sugar-specific transcriptional regulator TrmB
MNEAELTELLEDLGLSRLETKVYLALVKLNCEPVTAKAVSDNAEVHRQDTYRVLSDLLHRGIVEKILGDPLKFRGLPLQIGISVLLEQRTNAYFAVKEKSMQALKHNEVHEKICEPESQMFSLTSNLQLLLTKLKNDVKNTNSKIEMIYNKEKMSIISFHLLEDLQQALERGVRVYLITTSAPGEEIERNLRALYKTDSLYENLQVRVVNETPGIGLALFDGARCYIRTAQSLGYSLFSNNSNITSLASYYFRSVWEKASKTTLLA